MSPTGSQIIYFFKKHSAYAYNMANNEAPISIGRRFYSRINLRNGRPLADVPQELGFKRGVYPNAADAAGFDCGDYRARLHARRQSPRLT